MKPDALDPERETEQVRQWLIDRLQSGAPASDGAFDRFLPLSSRLVSSQFWTPIAVIQRAASWIDEHEIASVVDVGAGAGKFCVGCALASRATFVGVEHRARLVSVASRLAARFSVLDRVSFVEGDAARGLPVAEAYYLFNPFGENLFPSPDHLDDDVELCRARYLSDIDAIERMLADSAVGTFLLTYNGFGGGVPATFQEIRVARDLPSVLRLWRKTRAHAGGLAYAADAR